MISRFSKNSDNAIDSHICTSETFENLMLELGDEVRDWCSLHFFSGKLGQALICPLGYKKPIALLGCGWKIFSCCRCKKTPFRLL